IPRPSAGRSLKIWLDETATLTLRHCRVNTACDASPDREVRHTAGSRSGDPASRTRVDLVLRGLETAREQELRGVGGLVEQDRQLLALGGGEVLEHEVRGVLPARRAADADA